MLNNNLLLKYNILINEKNDVPCKYSLNYENINSNSTLESLISVFRNSIFDDIIEDIMNNNDIKTFINLKQYNKILENISKRLLNKLNKYSNIKLIFNKEICNITYDNKIILVENFKTKICIVSIGAKQDMEYVINKDENKILDKKINKCVLPHDIFDNSYKLSYLNNKKIGIIGSSHSSISILDCFLSKKIKYKSLTLLCRNDFKVFFKNKNDMNAAGFKFNEEDICSETSMINRFDGLRENSKKIYMNLDKYNINKICDKNFKLDEYDIIIPCWGYYKLLPKINNILYKKNIDSNINFELTIKKKIFKNIFLLGINSNPKIKITQKSFKKV